MAKSVREILLSFTFALVVGSAINGCMQSTAPPTTTAPAPPGGESAPSGQNLVQPTTEVGFGKDVLKADTPVLVEFGAAWCAPCKIMAPVIEELATQYQGKVKFVKVDIDSSPELAQKYKIGPIPAFLFFKGGTPVETLEGAVPKSQLAEGLDRLTN